MTLHQTSSYDQLPYTSTVMPYAQPERLAIIATLFGLQPPPLETCRVLELGCADGSNLIATAKTLPQADCWGVDLSERQIADGQQLVDALGLTNVTLRPANITAVDAEFGQFDYIIAHGIYSWVPADVQAHILAVCKRNLAPNGIAYVSYNTYPGWHMRMAMREMLVYHTQPLQDPKQKVEQLRALLKFLRDATATDNTAYSKFLQQEFEEFSQSPEPYLYHEFLEENSEPLYLHQFVARARAAGLEYLGDAHFHTMLTSQFAPEVEKTLDLFKEDLVRQEQYMDFVRNRHFRHTLLCHQETQLNRTITASELGQFYISSSLAANQANPPAENEQAFSNNKGSMTSNNPVVQVALRYLNQQFPCTVSLSELTEQAIAQLGLPATEQEATRLALINALFTGYANGLIDFHLLPAKCINTVSDKPVASHLARTLAKQQARVPNLRCELLNIQNIVCLWILPLLDGQHDRAGLLQQLTEWVQAGQLQLNTTDAQTGTLRPLSVAEVDAQVLSNVLDEALQVLAQAALLEQ